MSIILLKSRATPQQAQAMLAELTTMIKIVVDIRQGILAGGGEMHSDCESLLLDNGSKQIDLWGANWFPASQQIEFESLINIRPRDGNRSIIIQDPELCRKVETITRQILGDVS